MTVMQERRDASLKRLEAKTEAKMHSHHEELKVILKAGQGKTEVIMEACLGKLEATDLAENPEEIEFQPEHLEAPKENSAVETIRALEDRPGD
jgi:hypothetical protein